MKPLPELLIVTDRGHLIAYRSRENGSLERIDAASFYEGTEKLSEIVTDQAGTFPNPGGYGRSSAERLPLIAELEMRCFRKIAEKIRELVDRENCLSWGFAAPSEINGAILDGLEESYYKKLAVNMKLDLTKHSAGDVAGRFQKAREARFPDPS